MTTEVQDELDFPHGIVYDTFDELILGLPGDVSDVDEPLLDGCFSNVALAANESLLTSDDPEPIAA